MRTERDKRRLREIKNKRKFVYLKKRKKSASKRKKWYSDNGKLINYKTNR